MKRLLLSLTVILSGACGPEPPTVTATVMEVRLVTKTGPREDAGSSAVGGAALGYLLGGNWGAAAGGVLGAASADTKVVTEPTSCMLLLATPVGNGTLTADGWYNTLDRCALMKPGDKIPVRACGEGKFCFVY